MGDKLSLYIILQGKESKLSLGTTLLRKKSRIRETLNLSTDADSSTDTKMDRNGHKGPFFLHF